MLEVKSLYFKLRSHIYTQSMVVVTYILGMICILYYIKTYTYIYIIDFFSMILLFMMDIWKAYSRK